MTKLPKVARRSLIRGLCTLLLPLGAASAALAASPVQIAGPNNQTSGMWPAIQAPLGNPFIADASDPHTPQPGSATEGKQFLGLALFWDEQLSSDGTMACGTCHSLTSGGYDERAMGFNADLGRGSLGIVRQDSQRNFIADPTPTQHQRQVTSFMAPTMVGAGFLRRVLWRANAGPTFTPTTPGVSAALFPNFAALEDQAVGPVLNNVEMAHEMFDFATVAAKLNGAKILDLATFSTVPGRLKPIVNAGMTYGQLFDILFANDPNFGGQVGVTRDRIAMAIATYERCLVPNQAPIDMGPLNAAAQRGFDLFFDPINQCNQCHVHQTQIFGTRVPVLTGTGGFVEPKDAVLTDGRVHGPINFPGDPFATGDAIGNIGVKTPTLRNMMLKQRFGHNGFMGSMTELMDFLNFETGTEPVFRFDNGSGPQGRLTAAERADVIAFFESLTDPRLVPTSPGAQLPMPFSRPDLYSQRVPFGSNEPANLPGTAAPGGSFVPDIIAHLPAIGDDPFFLVGVGNAPPNAIVRLGLSPNPLPAVPSGSPLHLNLTGVSVINMSSNVDGFATHKAAIPSALIGQTMSFQATVFDQAVSGVAFTNAAEIVVQ